MKKFKKYLSLVAFSTLFFAGTANAQFAVAVVTCATVSASTGMSTCASESTLYAQYLYLTTGQQTSIMGQAGSATGMSQGVIEMGKKANDTASQAINGQQQDMSNADAAARQRDYSLKQRETIDKYVNPMSESACRDASLSGGLGGGGAAAGGGGISGGTAAAAARGAAKQEERVLSPRTEATSLTELVSGRNKNYCKPEDIVNKMPGCEGGVGTLPGANLNIRSIFMGAKKDPQKSNLSIPESDASPERQAALDYITMNSPRPALNIPDAAKSGTAGKQFLVFQRRYNARVLAVTNAYNDILAMSTALPSDHPFVQKVWSKIGGEYKSVYPQRDVPSSPSEREMLNFMVDRQFGQKIVDEDEAGAADQVYLAKRNLEMQKLNAYLLLKVQTQLEKNYTLQAQSLAQDLDPVSYQNIRNMAPSASK